MKSKLYPIVLYVIALAIILSVTLASWQYIVGTDSHLAYYFAQEALSGWDASIAHPGNSAIGDVLFAPTLGIWFMFKIFYPMMFALVPVVLYYIYKKFLTDTEAFLACLFFISVPPFTMEIPLITRQMFAELFLALFFLALVSDYKRFPKAIMLIVCGGMVIMGHYSLGIVLIVITIAYFLITSIMRGFKYKLQTPLWINGIVMLVLVSGGIAYYYTVAGGTPLQFMVAIVPVKLHVGSYPIGYMPNDPAANITSGKPVAILTGGEKVGLVESYDNIMQAALGLDFLKASVLGKVYRVIQFCTFILLAIGTFYSLFKKRVRQLLKPEYLALIIISIGILGLCILSPGFASILNGTRWYHIALFTLAPMLVIGMKVITGRANENNHTSY